ncbi:MAG TPA: hypothetical protein VFV33_16560 [Gemmatimonadaceae bacterium]|nr:hypothetical protein [Gemmatimonadaceae bacterium]
MRVCGVLVLLVATAANAQPSRTSRPPVERGASRAPVTAAAPFVAPQWAYPIVPAPNPPPAYDSVTRHRLPGSSVTMTMAEAMNYWTAPDWFPDSHPPMPAAVRGGRRPEPRACGYCHLPDGRGRPENATLAGLPAEYIVAQVKAFADGSRLSANPQSATNSMHRVAAATRDDEVQEAARYFSGIRFVSRNRVVEATRVPRTRIANVLYVRDGEGTEPIAGRLIEIPEDFERHELHDPTLPYVTYVPPGSIARGRHLVSQGPAGPATACAICHGPTLRGVGLIPPIAGRPPSYILRQLINIRTGARHDPGSLPMQAVVARMSIDDMVGVAAYVGTLGGDAR